MGDGFNVSHYSQSLYILIKQEGLDGSSPEEQLCIHINPYRYMTYYYNHVFKLPLS